MRLPTPSLEALRAIERQAASERGFSLRLVCVAAPRLKSYGVAVQVLREVGGPRSVEIGEDLQAILGAYGNQIAERYGIPGVEIRWPAGGIPLHVVPLKESDGVVVDTLGALIDNYAATRSNRVPRRMVLASRGAYVPDTRVTH